MKLAHPDGKSKREKYVCETCGKKCQDPSAYRQHLITHADKNATKVQCELCGKWLKNQYTLRAHRSLHEQKTMKYKCPHCDKYKPISQLRQHIVVAHSDPTHKCYVCDKLFPRVKELREHLATHTGESLYNCKFCKMRFKCDANMYKHLRTDHKEEWEKERAQKE